MSARALEVLVPGDLQSATGGYGYDRRIIAGLQDRGWCVNVHALDGSFPFPTSAALEHAEAVFSSIPDDALVMVDGLAFGALPALAEQHARRVRLIALVHHPLALETGLSRASAEHLAQSERVALRCARHVFVTSEATAAALAAYDVDRERISVIVPGTDAAPLAVGSSNSSDGCVNLLCVATLTPRKGHDLLIEALAALTSLPWRLTCVGSLTRDAGTVAAVRKQIHQAGLDQRVALVGELTGDALEAVFHRADLFVLPTRHEGYGMVVAEALARGIPVISTRTGAIAELVSSIAPVIAPADEMTDAVATEADPAALRASAGLLVPTNDGAAFQRALARALRDPGLRASLREGARRVREHLPRWPESCARMSQVLQAVSSS